MAIVRAPGTEFHVAVRIAEDGPAITLSGYASVRTA